MDTRFDLKQMLKEIEDDKRVQPRASQMVSQDEIRDRVLRKRKAAENAE